jgi:hypothetical protein|tara:strand:- start:194 stop:325 length:132 start_codon:yes stop_codon:yes gene_type:complete
MPSVAEDLGGGGGEVVEVDGEVIVAVFHDQILEPTSGLPESWT